MTRSNFRIMRKQVKIEIFFLKKGKKVRITSNYTILRKESE